MSEVFKIFLTSSLTILGGVFVFSITLLIQKFLIEPAHEQAKAVGQIGYCLIFFAPWYANPGNGQPNDMDKASAALRECASRLVATSNAIRSYRLFERVGLIPPWENVEEATGHLIRISNSIFSGNGRENSDDAAKIRGLLWIKQGEPATHR